MVVLYFCCNLQHCHYVGLYQFFLMGFGVEPVKNVATEKQRISSYIHRECNLV